MKISPGYSDIQNTNQVYRSRNALYGLKQSSRAWFGRFSRAIQKFGNSQCNGDHSLFHKHSNDAKVTVLVTYVDDIIITRNDLDM